MEEKIMATLSVERELQDEFRVIEYDRGNGDVHFHSQIEICIVEDGSVEALINNNTRTLSRGDIAISLRYDSHRYISKDRAHYSVLLMPSDVCEKFYAAIQTAQLSGHFICRSERSEICLEYLAKIKEDIANDLERMGYLYLILGIIKEELLSEATQELSDSELLSKILLYVHKNYNKELTLSSIAKVFGYHPGYISSYFKSRLDIGLSSYINVIRLKNAIQLMQTTNYNVTRISLECGFNSTRTFYRAFRNEFGCSPTEYASRLN